MLPCPLRVMSRSDSLTAAFSGGPRSLPGAIAISASTTAALGLRPGTTVKVQSRTERKLACQRRAQQSCAFLRRSAQNCALSGKPLGRVFLLFNDLMADPARFELTTSAFGGDQSEITKPLSSHPYHCRRSP